ncbi:Piso0_002553 [Millerozyma farinosa CBS 7064]|uniref:Piso0_002553 protein n=1 Tax=Pichia sorbitophila (strain ATCC MYA-4447 / BCRC 22081 / CBS 7064 / NBRC 10061 / NRRL Y-12695) TaxID=559304 RepID=G8YFC6_PICSO|nr:Piso0_002553 [Millerozyma farinosa CBS 7064]
MLGLPEDDNERWVNLKQRLLQRKKLVIVSIIVIVHLILFFSTNAFGYFKILIQPTGDKSICPIADSVGADWFADDNSTIIEILQDERFRLKSVEKLSRAVQVDTQIGDEHPNVPDAPEVWAKFEKFHKYLEKTFSVVYENLEVEKLNTYGLLFTWKGKNASLKPLLLMAHQDTVPVQADTLKDWTYPPFEGHYDGEYIYGRGASDCKNVLVAILESLEILIGKNYTPERSIIVSFGFDEESSGRYGAKYLAAHLEKKLGPDSIHAIVDEGPGLSLDALSNRIIATPATSEKGFLNLAVELTTPGGHSSMPPDHTSIGIVSELGYFLEQDPYGSELSADNPMLKYLQCAAVHSDQVPALSKKAILRAGFDKLARSKVLEALTKNPIAKYIVKTTQALDVIRGGEKANALPENVNLIINFRLNIESTLDQVKQKVINYVLTVADKYDLGVTGFGKELKKGDGKSGYFNVTSLHELPAAPVSPTEISAWDELAGTTRYVFENFVFPGLGYPIISAPVIMPANTDTAQYWNLTKNIYRYTPGFLSNAVKDTRIHSVDERLPFDNHLQLVSFLYEYLQVVSIHASDTKTK